MDRCVLRQHVVPSGIANSDSLGRLQVGGPLEAIRVSSAVSCSLSVSPAVSVACFSADIGEPLEQTIFEGDSKDAIAWLASRPTTILLTVG